MEPATAAVSDGGRLEARDLATGSVIGAVQTTPPDRVERAVAASRQVQPLWAQLRLLDRARYMRRAAQAIVDEFDELLELVAREQGRPKSEVAVVELLPAIEALRWMAAAAPRLLGGRRVSPHRALFPLMRARVEYEPLGVVGVIGARGAPFAQPLGQVAAALLAGNGVVLKPSPGACLTGERIGRALARAGLPEGLVRIVQGEDDVGGALVQAELDALFFTGRGQAGSEIRAECGRRGRPLVLECGGGDAMVVLADAQVTRAVGGAAWAGFAAAGLARGSVKRIYVAREVVDHFAASLAQVASELRVGPPLDPGVQVGPLPSAQAADRLEQLVGDAVADGARRLTGGPVRVPGLSGSFYAPTVLADVAPEMRIMHGPIEGPVVGVVSVDSTAEAIELANRCATGIGASVWTANPHQGRRIARELRAGAVWLNDHLISPAVPQGPWGGAGQAGAAGRSHGEAGLRACAGEKLVTWEPPWGRPAWWFLYDEIAVRAWRAFAQLGSARDSDRQKGLRGGSVPLARLGLRTLRGARSP